MRIYQASTLIFFGATVVCLAVWKPSILAQNGFVAKFMDGSYINILSVIVTVSLVSITQIHLEYARVERRFKQRVFDDARREINISALILVGLLVVGFVISFLRAEIVSDETLLTVANGLSLISVLATIFIMYDIIMVVHALASEEPLD